MEKMVDNYAIAYTQVYSIINSLDSKEKSKIPNEEILYIKNHMDKAYKFLYDPKKSLKNNNVSKDAAIIILYLWKKYFLNKEKYATLEGILQKNDIAYQEELSEKFSIDKIFNNNDGILKEIYNENINESEVENKKELVVYEYKWYQKIIDKLKEFLNKE